MTSTTKQVTSTKRITDEMFAAAEKAAAERADAGLIALPPIVSEAAGEQTEQSGEALERLAIRVLPYVWTLVIAIWVNGALLMQTILPATQCIAIGGATLGVLWATVFAWRKIHQDIAAAEGTTK